MLGTATPPFLGRQRELAVLRSHLTAAQAGRGSLIQLAGDAGIGKTALARAFAEEVATQRSVVL